MTISNIELKKNGIPIYRQIAGALADQVQSGQVLPGSKLPTHRALADQLSVTVGTVTRAYSEAERQGIVEARVGAGTYISAQSKPAWTFAPAPEPGITNFGYNVPPAINRADLISEALTQLASHPQELNNLMLYHPPAGFAHHREILADWLQGHGVNLAPSQLLFSNGAQNAMQLTLQTLCRPGDTVLVEKMTYPGLLSLARQFGLTVKPVEMDEEGLLPDALAAAIHQYRPRLVYTTPTLQNPTTAVMGSERRKAIVDVCCQHQLVIVEDDVNGLLPESRPGPLVNLAPEQVIHIGGLAKSLAPGLRLGYLHLPTRFYPAFVNALQNHCWMISPLITAMAVILLENGSADRILEQIRQQMGERWKIVTPHLRQEALRYHSQGFHGWVSLPDGWPLSDFLVACRGQGLDVKSSELFVPPGYPAPPCIRIAASAPVDLEQLELGIKKLCRILAHPPLTDFSL